MVLCLRAGGSPNALHGQPRKRVSESLLVPSSLHHGDWGYTYGEAEKYSTGRESRRGATHQAQKSVHGVKDAVLCVIGWGADLARALYQRPTNHRFVAEKRGEVAGYGGGMCGSG
jgi:hypothetical protein